MLPLTRAATATLRALSSYALACALFLLLLLLTYLGTLEQVESGLFHAQQKYFSSLFLIYWLRGAIPIPLPGAYLLLGLLAINIFLGGLLHLRKRWQTAGVLTVHAGILLLIAGGFVSHHFGERGRMRLFEGDQANAFQSNYAWEIVVATQDRAFVIPEDVFAKGAANATHTIDNAALPFTLTLHDFVPNARPVSPSGQPLQLQSHPPEPSHDQNVPGLQLTLQPRDSSSSETLTLWGLQSQPAEAAALPGSWRFDLRRERYPLPFSIALDSFTREVHPGTDLPSTFSSAIRMIEGETEQQVHITMNEPFRHRGYTFYQASWGPQDGTMDGPFFSVLAVSRNPADRFPLYACIIIAGGMSLHFTQRLRRFLRRESREPRS